MKTRRFIFELWLLTLMIAIVIFTFVCIDITGKVSWFHYLSIPCTIIVLYKLTCSIWKGIGGSEK
jgi:hypothetical protein